MGDSLVTGTDFIGIISRDAERSLKFYKEVLGFKQDDKAQYELWSGSTCFAVWEPEKSGRPFEASNNSIALRVDDVDQARTKLEALGVEFKGDTIDTGVCKMAMFEDPDGNALMFHHRYKPRD